MKACGFPHCTNVQEERFCTEHKRKPKPDLYRGSAAYRGYDGDWQKFRAWFVKRHPLCVDCLLEGKPVAVQEVHHIKKLTEYPELRLVESNCLALCKSHHSTRTQRGE
jgi:5-methylcytosine-specific restriction protein A